MVTQLQWEDDIIWSGEEAKARVLQSQKTRAAAAGWIPSTNHRTAAQFLQQSKNVFKPKRHEKTNILHMRKQRRRSASR